MNEVSGTSEIILYQTEDGRIRLEVRLQNETVWMSQKLIAELFQKDIRTINEHLINIYAEGELQSRATIRKFRIVQKEGAREVARDVDFYNLEAIIAVGYRVNSQRGTHFRQWATQRLNEYLVKGFIMDDERLKEGVNLGSDYFDEILERIRTSAPARNGFIKKYGIFTDWRLIMILRQSRRWNFSGSFRINCILLFQERQPPS